MSTTLSIVEQRLRDSVAIQLEWDPEVDASLIGVSAKDGIVVLTGYVGTYAEKLAAERLARRTVGVKAVVNEIEVRLAHERIDPEIARDAIDALKAHISVPITVTVTVRDGHVSLSGTAEWMYQKVAAERAVRPLRGVRGVFNHITINPTLTLHDVEKRIVTALHHQAAVDAQRIRVETNGTAVILSGNVRSWIERDEAERAVWRTPGVTTVQNRIAIAP